MAEATTAVTSWNLGSDLPLVDPAEDAFGYAPFASQLAQAIVSNNNPQGLVLSVHGKWGSGKSSLMNFIKYNLKNFPESERPIIVDFNPWWFEGREQITTQLLAEFSGQLPDKLKLTREVAKQISKYSKEIANAAATYSGYPWVKKPIELLANYIPKLKALVEPEGVPKVKKKVAAALKASGKRFVFFVDDIDRLTPDEARDLFRAIKALADFPEVVYVLFFDREEVSKALTATLKMDGEAYLEKIVQAPFHLPAVDKSLLQQKLFKGLDAIIESRPMPFPFDQSRWAEVFNDGLDQCIRKPRDIVRILNAISVAYPSLAGEVNPIDFIALEFLRVFETATYGSIRDGQDFFCGFATQLDHKKATETAYFEKWRDSLPESSQEWLVSLIGRIFPKVAQVLESSLPSGFLASGDDSDWRKELRPCSPECFGVYFQFGIPAGHITRAELDRLVNSATSEEMVVLLLESKEYVFPDGHSKARDLIERLHDFNNLEPVQAAKLITALISHAQYLLRPEDERGGFFSLPNRWRILGLATKLMEPMNLYTRQELLTNLVYTSSELWGVVGLIDMALESKKDSSKAPKAMLDLDETLPPALSQAVGQRLNQASLEELLTMSELDYIVDRWGAWGDPTRIPQVFKPIVDDDNGLLTLLIKFVRTGLRHAGNRTTETYHLSMKSLALVIDLDAMEPRISSLQSRSNLTTLQRAALNSYRKGLQRIREGKDPDASRYDVFDE